MQNINSSLKLGSQLNLIKGIKWNWDIKSETGSPFFVPDRSPQFTTQDLPEFDPSVANFNQQKVAFYYSWRDLVEGMYHRWHIPEQSLSHNSSTFVLKQPRENDIINNLCTKLALVYEDIKADINKDNKDELKLGFALVTLTKSVINGSFDINKPGVISNELKDKLSQLPDDAGNVAPFLSFFNEYGTHYVSSLEIGDVAYQVFVYEAVQLLNIETIYRKNILTDAEALDFHQYVGKSKYIGDLNLLSEDPYFQQIKQFYNKEWQWRQDNIFSVIGNDRTIYKSYTTIVPISCNLTSISNLLPRKAQVDAWARVFQNALYTKYAENIDIVFPPVIPTYNYKEIYKSFQQPFVSTISTANITINQIRVELDEFITQNPDNVKQVFVFADVVELAKDVNLPGDTVTIVCRKFISYPQINGAPAMLLTKKGYANFKLYCQEFDGIAIIKSLTTYEHKLICNGSSYHTFIAQDQQITVDYEDRHDTAPPMEVIRLADNRTLYTLGIPLQSAQAIMNYPAGDNVYTVVKLFTQWLADILKPATKDDLDLINIRSQALLLLKAHKNLPGGTLTVPILTYDAYKPAIDAMMNAVDAFHNELHANNQLILSKKSLEQTYKNQQELNSHIQAMGKFLVDTNNAMAEKEKDVVDFYNKINEKQQTMLANAQRDVNQLKNKLSEQQNVMKDAADKLNEAVQEYTIEETINLILQLAGAMVGFFTGMANIGKLTSSKLSSIKQFMISVETAAKMIEAVSKLYEMIKTENSTINPIDDTTKQIIFNKIKDLQDLPSDAGKIMNDLEWTEYDAQVYEVISPITDKIPYANTYLKEAKIFSARGRAYIDAALQVTKIMYDQLLNSWQKDIAQKQANRLTELDKTLNPADLSLFEPEKIDLMELGSMYQAHSQRVILQLVKTLFLQDAALQYYYLQAPSQISSYDILSLKEFLVSQADNSIAVMESFPSKPSNLRVPYVYILKGVKVSDLIDDGGSTTDNIRSKDDFMQYTRGGYKFNILLDVPELYNYVRVRINEIKMKIDGIQSTDSGQVDVRLVNDAQPFYDRGLNRQAIEYDTIPQSFEYVYNLKTGKCIYTNKPAGEFAKYYMKMTPFTAWRISLPTGKSSENAGIKFKSDTVDIIFSFSIEAIRLSVLGLNSIFSNTNMTVKR